MNKEKQLRGEVLAYLVSCMLVVIALEGSFVRAIAQTGKLPRASSALLLQRDGIYDFGGQVVRCLPGQKVGIWAETRISLTIANVVVEGCAIGIVVTGNANDDILGSVIHDTNKSWSARVEGVRTQLTTIGFFLAGTNSIATGNIAGGGLYGFVITGDNNILQNNQSNDNKEDGYLVTGDRNLLEGNEARRNGGFGIHVARMVPMVERRRFLSLIQDRGLSNTIRGNIVLDNKIDLVEFTDTCEEENLWIGNTFQTRRPDCIEQVID